MWENKKAWKLLSQHERLDIIVMDEKESCFPPRRKVAVQGPWSRHDYYFVYVASGTASYFIDDIAEEIKEGQLLFVVPHQIYFQLKAAPAFRFYKLTFGEDVLTLLPGSFSFLDYCFNAPVVSFDTFSQKRVCTLMQTLRTILKSGKGQTELIIAYVNTLLSEIETAYQSREVISPQLRYNIQKFHFFRGLVEKEYTQQPTAAALAARMDISTDTLNRIVARFSGHNVKEYIIRRIIKEAKRNLFYENASIKELAYNLGFSDPNYFSRLFKNKEGISITDYVKKMRHLSR